MIEVKGVPAEPPTKNVITDTPFVISGETVYALICISPNNATKGKPGTWTGKHGFLAANCQTASDAASQWIPSGNAPVLD